MYRFRVYAKLSDESTKSEVEFIQGWGKQRQGVALKVYDLDAGDKERSRLKQIESAYTRQGCSKCIEAKAFLEGFVERYPGIEAQYLDAVGEEAAKKSYGEIIRNQRIGGGSFPGFWFCQQLVIGFESAIFTTVEAGLADLEHCMMVAKWTSLPTRQQVDRSTIVNHPRTFESLAKADCHVCKTIQVSSFSFDPDNFQCKWIWTSLEHCRGDKEPRKASRKHSLGNQR